MACVAKSGWPGLLLAVALWGCSHSQDTQPRVVAMQSELKDAFAANETVSVIVTLREPAAPRERGAVVRAIADLHDSVLERVGSGFQVTRRLKHTPAFAGRINRDALDRLMSDERVSYVQVDGIVHGQLKEAVPAAGVDQVESLYKLTGRGVRVAVLDSGIDLTHPDLREAVVVQQCFVTGGCPPFSLNEGINAQDDHGHGTHVAGVIASRGAVSSPGFAREAELIAVKVCDSNNNGSVSDVLAGLDWVYENLATLQVKIVNLSIGSDQLFGPDECDLGQPAMARAIRALVDAGVTVFAGSGNRGSTTSMCAPACNTGSIAVGASYDSPVEKQPPSSTNYLTQFGLNFAACADDSTSAGQVTCFTNTSSRLDLVAPGAPMLTDQLGGDAAVTYGTSQASAAASGVAALMLQCNPRLSPTEIKDALVRTGEMKLDTRSMLSFPGVRALEAIRDVCPELMADAGAPPPDNHAVDAGSAMTPDQSTPDVPKQPTGVAVMRDAQRSAVLGGKYTAGASAPPLSGSDMEVAEADAGDRPSEPDRADATAGDPPGAEGSNVSPRSDGGCSCHSVGARGRAGGHGTLWSLFCMVAFLSLRAARSDGARLFGRRSPQGMKRDN
jgi:hypothetical protein